MARIAVFFIGLMLSTPAHLSAQSSELALEPVLRGTTCEEALREQLTRWGVTVEAELHRIPASAGAMATYRIPTEQLGVWVTLELSGRDSRLSRISPEGSATVTFDRTCRPRREVHERIRGAAVPTFDDAQLASKLSQHDHLVVYLWSPHMPLSVDGYREIRRACERLGLALEPVLDPSADAGYARRMALSGGLPKEALRRLDSVELLFRDLAVHAPTVIAFVDGRPSAPLPGFRKQHAYVDFLQRSER